MSARAPGGAGRAPAAERLDWPPVGPWHAPGAICEWVVWIEEEMHLAGDDDEIIRLRRRLLVSAGCWLWDHEFPSREPR